MSVTLFGICPILLMAAACNSPAADGVTAAQVTQSANIKKPAITDAMIAEWQSKEAKCDFDVAINIQVTPHADDRVAVFDEPSDTGKKVDELFLLSDPNPQMQGYEEYPPVRIYGMHQGWIKIGEKRWIKSDSCVGAAMSKYMRSAPDEASAVIDQDYIYLSSTLLSCTGKWALQSYTVGREDDPTVTEKRVGWVNTANEKELLGYYGN